MGIAAQAPGIAQGAFSKTVACTKERQPPAAEYEQCLYAIMQQRNLVDVAYALLTFNMPDAPRAPRPAAGGWPLCDAHAGGAGPAGPGGAPCV